MKTRSHLGLVAILLAVGTACSPFGYGEDRFYDQLGKIGCEKAFECDLEAASETWFNQDNCEESYALQASASVDAHQACTYRRQKAKTYVKLYKELGCTVSPADMAEIEQAWSDVYEREGEVPGTTGDTGTADDTGLLGASAL